MSLSAKKAKQDKGNMQLLPKEEIHDIEYQTKTRHITLIFYKLNNKSIVTGKKRMANVKQG